MYPELGNMLFLMFLQYIYIIYIHTHENVSRIPLTLLCLQLCTVRQFLRHTPNRSPNLALTQNNVDVMPQNRIGHTPWLSLSGTHGAHNCTPLYQGMLPGTPHSTGQSVPLGGVGTILVPRKSTSYLDPNEYAPWWLAAIASEGELFCIRGKIVVEIIIA